MTLETSPRSTPPIPAAEATSAFDSIVLQTLVNSKQWWFVEARRRVERMRSTLPSFMHGMADMRAQMEDSSDKEHYSYLHRVGHTFVLSTYFAYEASWISSDIGSDDCEAYFGQLIGKDKNRKRIAAIAEMSGMNPSDFGPENITRLLRSGFDHPLLAEIIGTVLEETSSTKAQLTQNEWAKQVLEAAGKLSQDSLQGVLAGMTDAYGVILARESRRKTEEQAI